ncbi:hypothetical protein E3O06_11620 [Cryobacterium glaciale]|uniref:Uncharacterized protein n=1 Tax=Cryobacterium glaciale TaxID=1259145 RepID=A0A4R8UTZ3_9MICO|nr:hypothetical protein [Cryobacterium glaciale]TFB71901.1 hypothetical protein E3O06_11620 [Cryobacterium glaciale]
MHEVEEIRVRNWTQGSIVSGSDLQLSTQVVGGDDPAALYVVASHPCDVVNSDFIKEPHVDILPMNQIDSTDGSFTHGKNPRKLHLDWNGDAYAVDLIGRRTIDRRLLAGATPQGQLEAAVQRVLAAWLGSRYSRPAFADEFNARVEGTTSRIGKALKNNGQAMSGIYVATTLDELPSGSDYPLQMLFCMRTEDFVEPDLWGQVDEAAEQIAKLMRECEGVDLIDYEVKSEADTSLEELRTFARWDYDWLTFRTLGSSESTLSLIV